MKWTYILKKVFVLIDVLQPCVHVFGWAWPAQPKENRLGSLGNGVDACVACYAYLLDNQQRTNQGTITTIWGETFMLVEF